MKNTKSSIIIAVLVTALLSGCGKAVLKPTESDVMKVATAMQESATAVTAKEVEAAQTSAEGKKALLKKTIVDSFSAAGFDADQSLQSFAKKWIEKDVTQEEAQYVMVLLNPIIQSLPQLKEHSLLAPETIALLEKVKM